MAKQPRILILGTGLIGTSIGLALRALREPPEKIFGWDAHPEELAAARALGAIDEALTDRAAVLTPGLADIYVLATPVMPILDWMRQLAPVLTEAQLVTDVGSTKAVISAAAAELFNCSGRAHFLPGHPMAGKESGGAALAEPTLFRGAAWLFTPERGPAMMQPAQVPASEHSLETCWREMVAGFGATVLDLPAARHDELCAWVSHLPQMLSTALAALLQEAFADDPEGRAAVNVVGGRALRETTRLGSSPYSMWRDVALTNTEPIAFALQALEQKLAHLRENLRTPELRAEFHQANQFRVGESRKE